jgi:hypothetical protein
MASSPQRRDARLGAAADSPRDDVLTKIETRRLLDAAPAMRSARSGPCSSVAASGSARPSGCAGPTSTWSAASSRSSGPSDRSIARFRRTGQPRLQLVEPKTPESRRTMAMPVFVVDALERHRERHGQPAAQRRRLVFTSPRGTPLDPRNVTRAWQAFSAAAGLPTDPDPRPPAHLRGPPPGRGPDARGHQAPLRPRQHRDHVGHLRPPRPRALGRSGGRRGSGLRMTRRVDRVHEQRVAASPPAIRPSLERRQAVEEAETATLREVLGIPAGLVIGGPLQPNAAVDAAVEAEEGPDRA